MKCRTCGSDLQKSSKYCSSCGTEVVYSSTNPRFSRPPEKYQGPKRLYRSRSDRIVAGVAGGMAQYFEVDANLIRLIWAVSIFSLGIGLIPYILAIILIPESPLDPWAE